MSREYGKPSKKTLYQWTKKMRKTLTYRHQYGIIQLSITRKGNDMKRNINPTIVHDILDAIATVFVFIVMGFLAIVFLAITGCSTKSANFYPQLEPTYQVTTNDNGELEIIVKAKSRSLSMAMSKAQFRARQEFAKHLDTNIISGARVVQQQIGTDESGIFHTATIKMVMPQ